MPKILGKCSVCKMGHTKRSLFIACDNKAKNAMAKACKRCGIKHISQRARNKCNRALEQAAKANKIYKI